MVFLLLTFTLSEKAGKWLYFIWVVTMFGTMAGTTTYLTAATATTFGLKYFSTNYGLVSSSMVCIWSCLLEILQFRACSCIFQRCSKFQTDRKIRYISAFVLA
jgi:hypothetical protein